MRNPGPGNRIVVGDSGVPFEVAEAVASGLVASKAARYADGAQRPKSAAPRPVTDPAAQPVAVVVKPPTRRGRRPAAARDAGES